MFLKVLAWIAFGIGAFIVSMYLASGVVLLVRALGVEWSVELPLGMLVYRLVTYVILALLIGAGVIYRSRKSVGTVAGLTRPLSWKDIGMAAAGVIIYLLTAVVALKLFSLIPGFPVDQAQDVGFSQVYGFDRFMAFIVLVILTPLFVLLLNPFWQKEILSNIDLIAIVVLIIGSLVISFEQSKQHHGWHLGMAWGVLAGLFFALSNLASKYIYDGYGFYSGLVWTRGMLGVCGILLLAAPTVRAVVFKKKKKIKIPMRSGVSRLFLVGTDKILGVVGVVMIQFAIATGSVTIVNALNGLQYAALVVMVALLSKFSPRLFHEDYAPAEIWQEIFAIVLIAVGLGLLIK
jgi:drug/metabolite transporter (DMT)-like permease